MDRIPRSIPKIVCSDHYQDIKNGLFRRLVAKGSPLKVTMDGKCVICKDMVKSLLHPRHGIGDFNEGREC